jgi:hypothetical protein
MKLTNTNKALAVLVIILIIALIVVLSDNNGRYEDDDYEREENYSSDYENDNGSDDDIVNEDVDNENIIDNEINENANEDNDEEVDLSNGQEDNLKEFEADTDIHNGLEPIAVTTSTDLSSSLDYSEFKEEVEDYRDLISFLDNNFNYVDSDSLVAKSPEAFFETKRGSAVDFAVFSFNVLDDLGYRTGVMRYDYSDSSGNTKTNFVTVFRAEEGPRHIVFNKQGVFLFKYGWSFQDLINTEEKRLDNNIDRYLYFVDAKNDLSEPGSIDWVINK